MILICSFWKKRRISDCLKETRKKLEIASVELEESNISYDKMKTEYEAIEEEVDRDRPCNRNCKKSFE